MLNLSQRLILGCVLLAGLTVGLAVWAHRALAAAGQSKFAWFYVVASLLVAAGTVYAVLRPITMLARDAKRIAQGNLEHRVEWSSRDDFGTIATELNRCGSGSCATRKRAGGRWSFNCRTRCCSRSLSRLLSRTGRVTF
jgi:HAMP domain-containing protein